MHIPVVLIPGRQGSILSLTTFIENPNYGYFFKPFDKQN